MFGELFPFKPRFSGDIGGCHTHILLLQINMRYSTGGTVLWVPCQPAKECPTRYHWDNHIICSTVEKVHCNLTNHSNKLLVFPTAQDSRCCHRFDTWGCTLKLRFLLCGSFSKGMSSSKRQISGEYPGASPPGAHHSLTRELRLLGFQGPQPRSNDLGTSPGSVVILETYFF